MTPTGLRARLRARDPLCGAFIKTPAVEVIEVMALSGLDFICLDAEHAPFDRARMDACLAVARALGLPALVRVPEARPAEVLKALDAGAAGIVAPHVDTVAQAEALARAAHFGEGGRGYAGSTRWAGFATRPMAEVLAMDADTVVLAQIEAPEAVDACEAIAAVEGIDGLFLGPADLAVCLGETSIEAAPVRAAIARVAEACAASGKAAATFAPAADATPGLRAAGVSAFFFASEHAWMLAGARATVAAFRAHTA